jgi:hypothetical protein
MNKLFRKHQSLKRFTACFLLLYLVHSFSITSLIASHHVPSNNIGSNIYQSCCVGHKSLPGNNNKPYSLFIAKQCEVKVSRVTDGLVAVPVATEVIAFYQPVIFSSNYSSPTFCLRDDAYKRYRRFEVFLV